MVAKTLNKIFLSASIPSPDRDKRFYDSADIIAIRDAVKALATVVIPYTHLIWGGHPAITPLIRNVLQIMNADVKKHVTLYQSEYFHNTFPKENEDIGNILLTKKCETREESLALMRDEMIAGNDFKAGIFIGGMEGVLDEYKLFKDSHRTALLLPVASTGAAAKIIFDELEPAGDKRLESDYAYMSLFRDLLKNILEVS
ncbi:MAG: hypothetical protein M0P01_08690 [Treponema sp.]|nr:hypothetical protein [Treponema sp.]